MIEINRLSWEIGSSSSGLGQAKVTRNDLKRSVFVSFREVS
jgi:hypothetical protein